MNVNMKNAPVSRRGNSHKPRNARPRFGGQPETRDKPPTPPHPVKSPKPHAPPDVTLIWGLHAVRAAWLNPRRKCRRLWASKAGLANLSLAMAEAQEALINRPLPKICDPREIDRYAPEGSVHQGLILETSPLPELSLHDLARQEQSVNLVLVLDQVTDPHNAGAILRSAAAFGAGAVIMTERHAPSATGVLAKAASGAVEHIPQIHVVNLSRAMETLHDAGFWIVGLAEQGEKNLHELDLKGRTALVLGAEGAGLRHLTRQKCDVLARLPTGGPIGSLNVSNAAAIALYEARKQIMATT